LDCLLFPYEEMQARIDSPNSLELFTPWFTRKTQLPASAQDLASFTDFLAHGTKKSPWSKFATRFAEDPLFYYLPRPQLGSCSLDQHASTGLTGLNALLASFRATHPDQATLLSHAWTRDWDTEAILAMSRIPDAKGVVYDPISIFSAIRRFYYLDLIEFDKTQAMYLHLYALRGQPSHFRDCSYVVAYQNFEVTRRCAEILAPALPLAQSARKILAAFIGAESGHHLIMQKGLNEFGICATSPLSQPLPFTTLMLDLFKTTAGNNFLAFAFAISLFEEEPQDGKDPLTEMVRAGGNEKAAIYFEQHFQINKAGGHDRFGIHLVQRMGPVTRAYAVEAIAFAEAMSKIYNSYTTSILQNLQAMS
jgi:hypothetical protein